MRMHGDINVKIRRSAYMSKTRRAAVMDMNPRNAKHGCNLLMSIAQRNLSRGPSQSGSPGQNKSGDMCGRTESNSRSHILDIRRV